MEKLVVAERDWCAVFQTRSNSAARLGAKKFLHLHRDVIDVWSFSFFSRCHLETMMSPS